MTFQRDRQPEQMDAPNLPKDEHLRALAGLARLNRVSGVATAMYRQLRRHAVALGDRPLNVLDVASGGGDVPVAWAARAKREGLRLQLTLLDVSAVAVEEQHVAAAFVVALLVPRHHGVGIVRVGQPLLDHLHDGLFGGFRKVWPEGDQMV